AGVFDCAVRAQVETGEGHVDDDERMLHHPTHHFGVVDHFVERYRQRALVPLYDHRHAVAYENALDARRVDKPSLRMVVGRDHRNLLAGGFEAGEFRYGDPWWSHGKFTEGGASTFALSLPRERLTTGGPLVIRERMLNDSRFRPLI